MAARGDRPEPRRARAACRAAARTGRAPALARGRGRPARSRPALPIPASGPKPKLCAAGSAPPLGARRPAAHRRRHLALGRRGPGHRRDQQRLRDRPGRPDPRPLRQGASRPLWRISADAADPVAPRPVAPCARRRRFRARARARAPRPARLGKVGFQLCYEIVFSGEVVDRAHRPDVIFNPSNDAWFGRWGPPQHLAQARLRALEEGLP